MTQRQLRFFHFGKRDRAPADHFWVRTPTGERAHLNREGSEMTLCARTMSIAAPRGRAISVVAPRGYDLPCNKCIKRWEEANL